MPYPNDPADESQEKRRTSPREAKPKDYSDYFRTDSIQFSETDTECEGVARLKRYKTESDSLQSFSKPDTDLRSDSDYILSCSDEDESESEAEENGSQTRSVWHAHRFDEREIVSKSNDPALQEIFRQQENYFTPQKVNFNNNGTPITNTGRRRSVRPLCEARISKDSNSSPRIFQFFQVSPAGSAKKSMHVIRKKITGKGKPVRRQLFSDPDEFMKSVPHEVISPERLKDAQDQKRESTRSFTGNRSAQEILEAAGFDSKKYYELSHIFAVHQGCLDIIHQYNNKGEINGLAFIVVAPKADNTIRLAMERAATQTIANTGVTLVYSNHTQLKPHPITGKPTHVKDTETNWWQHGDCELKIEIRAEDAEKLNQKPPLALNKFMDILFKELATKNDDSQACKNTTPTKAF